MCKPLRLYLRKPIQVAPEPEVDTTLSTLEMLRVVTRCSSHGSIVLNSAEGHAIVKFQRSTLEEFRNAST